MQFVLRMSNKMIIRNMLKRLVFHIIYFLQKNMNGYVNYLKKDYKQYEDGIEGIFVTKDNIKIPIYENYRYSVKKAWNYFEDLNTLSILQSRQLLSKSEEKRFKNFITNRTINEPLKDIREFAEKVFDRHGSLFLNDKKNIVKPELKQINNTINYYKEEHKVMFAKLKAFSIELPKSKKIVEIGFMSGGYSILGFEKLGYEAFGIDNCYDGIDSGFVNLPKYIQSQIESKAQFEYGDITKKTTFGDGAVDIIYSASVLEHIGDLESAFVEMRRILSDDGLLIHNYNPYYCSNGGHSLATMDSPWAHLLVDNDDFFDYMKKFRPHEYSLSKEWMEHALNKVSISKMQQFIIEAGFEILMWQEVSSPKAQTDLLTQKLMKDIFSKNKTISISDLITQNVFFVARKITQ